MNHLNLIDDIARIMEPEDIDGLLECQKIELDYLQGRKDVVDHMINYRRTIIGNLIAVRNEQILISGIVNYCLTGK